MGSERKQSGPTNFLYPSLFQSNTIPAHFFSYFTLLFPSSSKSLQLDVLKFYRCINIDSHLKGENEIIFTYIVIFLFWIKRKTFICFADAFILIATWREKSEIIFMYIVIFLLQFHLKSFTSTSSTSRIVITRWLHIFMDKNCYTCCYTHFYTHIKK